MGPETSTLLKMIALHPLNVALVYIWKLLQLVPREFTVNDTGYPSFVLPDHLPAAGTYADAATCAACGPRAVTGRSGTINTNANRIAPTRCSLSTSDSFPCPIRKRFKEELYDSAYMELSHRDTCPT